MTRARVRRRPLRPAVRDRGSATIWVLCGALTVLALGLVVLARSEIVLARHRVEAAADLAALAAASGIGVDASSSAMCSRARQVARSNGAGLDSCQVQLGPDGRTGTVTVRVSAQLHVAVIGSTRVSSSARAGRLPG
ncbi:MAG: Rv3654c family TadE-like protein [Jatrophihabitans sp.]